MANNTYNWSGYGVKSDPNGDPVKPNGFISHDKFDDGYKETLKEDTGNMGGASNIRGYIKTGAESNIKIDDKLRWNEGLEAMLYAFFGGDRVGTPIPTTALNKFIFAKDMKEELPVLTLIRGFDVWDSIKPVVYDNAVCDKLGIKLDSDGTVGMSVEFINDAPIDGIVPIDPTRVYKQTSLLASKSNLKILIGDVGVPIEDLLVSDCISELSIELENNHSSGECYSMPLGMSNKYRGALTGEISAKMNLNESNAKLERKQRTGSAEGHYVQEDMFLQQLAVVVDGPFTRDNANEPTSDKYKLLLHFPVIYMEPPKTSKEGSDTSELEVKFKTMPDIASGMPVNVEIESDLSEIPFSEQTYQLPARL